MRLPAIITFLTLTAAAHAQLIVDNSLTPLALTQDLVGEGISVFNVTFSGDGNQFGAFNSLDSNIPLPFGVMVSTGDCTVAVGPNDTGNETLGGGNFGSGDQDLQTLSTFATNDAAVLEFDFIPQGETVALTYVFASEEYNEYVCGSVNDVFGMFLSGPGIAGPFEGDAINIARIPGTDTPVSINTINNGLVGSFGIIQNCEQVSFDWNQNAAYFLDNETNPGPTSTQMDGFTVPMEALVEVEPFQVYHLKIAIADAGDTSFDSCVFLQTNSLSAWDSEGCPTALDANDLGQPNCTSWLIEVEDPTEHASGVSWSVDNVAVPDAESGSLFYEFPEEGTYAVCASVLNANCPNGVELCAEVVVDCPSIPCGVALSSDSVSGCGPLVFEGATMPTWEAISVEWTVNGEIQEEDGLTFIFEPEGPGEYTIGLATNDPECFSQATSTVGPIVVDETCFPAECDPVVEVSEVNCSYFLFDAQPIAADAYDWLVNGMVESSNQLGFELEVEVPGTYEVCLQYETELCGAVAWCDSLVVPGACFDSTCELGLSVIPPNACGGWTFQSSATQPVYWWVEGTNGEVSGEGMQFVFEPWASGTFEVCGVVESEQCPSEQAVCTEVTVLEECFTEICPTSEDFIATPGDTCGAFSFQVPAAVEGETVVWTYGDGTGSEGDNNAAHGYSENGSYEVCAFLSTTDCPSGAVICTEVLVDCFEEVACDTVAIGLDLPVDGPSNLAIEYAIFDGGQQAVLVGDCTYFESPFCDVVTCLEPGCHTVYLAFDPPLNSTEDIQVLTTSTATDFQVGEVQWAADFSEATFTLSTDASCNEVMDDCPTAEDFFIGAGSVCGMVELELGEFQEGEYAVWTFGDGTVETGGHFVTHTYAADGAYEVCVEFVSDACPSGVFLCDSLAITCFEAPCALEASMVAVTDCGPFQFSAETSDPANQLAWTVNNAEGVLLTEQGNNFTFGPDAPDLYEVCVTNESPNCPAGELVCFTVEVDTDCFADEPCPGAEDFFAGPGDTCGEMVFEIGEFQEGEAAVWDFGDGTSQPLGGHFITHTYSENGTYEVCVAYNSEACPEGVYLCQTVVIDCFEEPTCLEVDLQLAYAPDLSAPPAWMECAIYAGEELIASQGGDLDCTDFMEIDFYCNLPLCLDSGCYFLEVSFDPVYFWEATFAIDVFVEGTQVAGLGDITWEVENNQFALPLGVGVPCETAVGELGREAIRLFPNPAQEAFQIFGLPDAGAAVTLTDTRGRRMLQSYVRSGGLLDVSGLAPGMYLLHWRDGGVLRTVRGVVE